VSGNDLPRVLERGSASPPPCCSYLESFGNPRKFAQLAPTVAREKPIVGGSRPAHSRGAGSDVGVDALFEQAGVIRTDNLEELFEVAALLAHQPVPAGARVGVVGNAAGLAALFAAAGTAGGLAAARASRTRRASARRRVARARRRRTRSIAGTARPADYTAALKALGAAADIDAVVAIFVSPRASEAGGPTPPPSRPARAPCRRRSRC
jgi:acetyltransferase